jgi:hypothetical protein
VAVGVLTVGSQNLGFADSGDQGLSIGVKIRSFGGILKKLWILYCFNGCVNIKLLAFLVGIYYINY